MASDEAMRLRERRARAAAEYKTVLNEAEGRAFTADERTKLNTMDEELSNLDKQIKSVLDIDKRGQEADNAFAELESRQRTNSLTPLGSALIGAPGVQAWAALKHGHSVIDVRRSQRGSINPRSLLNTGSASATIPVDFYDQLISYLIEVSGLLQTGPTVLNTAGGETLQIPTVTSHP